MAVRLPSSQGFGIQINGIGRLSSLLGVQRQPFSLVVMIWLFFTIPGMEDELRVVNTLSDALGAISCIRFSPDGNRMVAASLDGNIYIYSVLENFKLQVGPEVDFCNRPG